MAFDARNFYATGEFSDLTIIAHEGRREFKVHKVIVCTTPPLKELALFAVEGRITVTESEVVMDALLAHLYGEGQGGRDDTIGGDLCCSEQGTYQLL